jgi:ribosomal protein S18 acetylase RimI-like enzyme
VLRGALRDYIRAHGDAEVLVEFVPPHFISQLESIGFVVHCEYVDFWLDQVEPLRDTARSSPIQIREATPEEHCIICSITRRCARQSRGFTVETRESLRTWLEEKDNALVVAVEHGLVVGHAMLAVYGFESPSGAVVWIRELAVEPDSQRKGIGRQLLVYGLRWGLARGAKRSFLACDAENQPAIRLYERFGYRRAAGRGQIDMAYVGSGDNPCAR